MDRNNDLNLVKAGTGDLRTIKQILDSCQLPSSDITDLHLKHFYILKKDNEAMGIVGLEIYENHGLLRSLATREEMRGRGFGKRLVNQIEEYAREQNVDEIYLLTTTAEDFFAKLGYASVNRTDIPQEVKNSEEFSSICPDSAASMKKGL
jgi:amino-acid N-acetyltransferase